VGYTKIVQYGDITEIYSYQKNLTKKEKVYRSKLKRERAREYKAYRIKKGTYTRTERSINRSRNNFYKLVHHNVYNAQTVHFLTLTFAYDITYKEAVRSLSRFMEKIKAHYETVPISYISVPELTKKCRYHFHLLVFDLPPDASYNERSTRNIQRQFQRGYIDITLASYTSTGIAGYLSKYMGKSLADAKSEAWRGFTCSRNIKKIYSAGGNTLDGYLDIIIPDNNSIQESQYEVKFMGTCYKKIIKQL